MNLYTEINNRQTKISVIGLGYVGLPIAVAFAEKADVIGFDINAEKIKLYKSGIDPTREVGRTELEKTTIKFTSDENELKEAKFQIITVPTPVHTDNTPDLSMVESASRTVGRNLSPGSVIVYESTVYPGVTEDICVPIIEKESGLKCGIDFKVGYSPERINPGDKKHRLDTITKVVAGMDAESLETIARVYGLVAKAGVFRAESIRVAEAAKVIENAQRDINIAFMNELSIIFNKMNIDTGAVLKAAGTKWNFLNFYPGLVGGHCIGVDPYYLTHIAEKMGYKSQVILAGRAINDNMGIYVAKNALNKLSGIETGLEAPKIIVFGITFKENCPDVRNSRVIDIIDELTSSGVNVEVVDPVANAEDVLKEYQIRITDMKSVSEADAVIFAVSHKEFRELDLEKLKSLFRKSGPQKPILIDVKGIFNKKEAISSGYIYWSL